MTTLGRRSPGLAAADREDIPRVGRWAPSAAEVRSMSAADPLSQEADLLVRAAKKAQERGLAADAELALWLERSMHRMWASGSGGGSPELAAALAIARALTGEGHEDDRMPGRTVKPTLA
jgi:4-diphosphocytidyl-2C-methyl-D-erythritol kinase